MKIDVNTEVYTDLIRSLSNGFDSGNAFLNNFIKSDESLDNNIGKTFVWLNKERTGIIGYYNIGVGYIDMFDGDEKYKVGGSIHLNFFALDEKYRGVVIGKEPDGTIRRLSDQLFADFLAKVYVLRDNYVGFSFVTLAATDEGLSLYRRHYFEELDAGLHFSFKDDEEGCIPMYLALE